VKLRAASGLPSNIGTLAQPQHNKQQHNKQQHNKEMSAGNKANLQPCSAFLTFEGVIFRNEPLEAVCNVPDVLLDHRIGPDLFARCRARGEGSRCILLDSLEAHDHEPCPSQTRREQGSQKQVSFAA
jgi:hypothetical protein